VDTSSRKLKPGDLFYHKSNEQAVFRVLYLTGTHYVVEQVAPEAYKGYPAATDFSYENSKDQYQIVKIGINYNTIYEAIILS
jgi:hypothetical protein